MRRLGHGPAAIGLLAATCAAGQTIAEPCVGVGFDRPFPGANSVLTRYADVPSPRFPGLWQEGRINGNPYVIYANGEATLRDAAPEPLWTVSIVCDLETGSCSQTVEGTPPPAAVRTASLMGQCFVSPGSVTAQVAPAQTPDPVAPAPPAAPCGLATVAEGDPGITLQLLLVAAGADPGPIDGLPGRRTRNALVEVLGQTSETLEIDEAVAALDTFLCEASD